MMKLTPAEHADRKRIAAARREATGLKRSPALGGVARGAQRDLEGPRDARRRSGEMRWLDTSPGYRHLDSPFDGGLNALQEPFRVCPAH